MSLHFCTLLIVLIASLMIFSSSLVDVAQAQIDPSSLRWQLCNFYTSRPTNATKPSASAASSARETAENLVSKIQNSMKTRGYASFLDDELSIDASDTQRLLELSRQERLGANAAAAALPYAPQAECAYVQLPLDYDNPNGQKIGVFAKRVRPEIQQPAGAPAKKQLFLLMGGPGGPSDALEPVMEIIYNRFGGQFEVYYVEHRGVGRSSRLGCVGPQAETAGSEGGVTITWQESILCAQEFNETIGDNGVHYSTTGAAKDVLSILRATKGDKESFVYGISYGTFWGSRIMQIDTAGDKLIRAIALDGIVAQAGKDRTRITDWDWRMNGVGFDLMRHCGQDTALCGKKLGNDPVAFVQQTFEKVFVNKTCKAITDKVVSSPDADASDVLRSLLGNLLVNRQMRAYIPSLLYRLNRCDIDKDVNVLSHFFFDNVFAEKPRATLPGLGSAMLQNNIMMSELYADEPVPTAAQLYEIFKKSHFASGEYTSAYTRAAWPVYTPPAEFYEKAWTTDKAQVLMLNGDLDPQTPFEFALQQYQDIKAEGDAKVYLVKIPHAVHYTLMNSPVNETGKYDCGLQVLFSFLENPDAQPDTSCVATVKAINWLGDQPLVNQALYGTTDLFEGFYAPPEVMPTVDLYLFIGVVALEAFLFVIILAVLLYVVLALRDKMSARLHKSYETLESAN